MHEISSYRYNRLTNKQTNKQTLKQTHKYTRKQTGPITIHCAAKLIARSVVNSFQCTQNMHIVGNWFHDEVFVTTMLLLLVTLRAS